MHRYIGFDVHKDSCIGVVMGPSGRRLREQRRETNGRVIREFVSSVAGTRHVCIEEGTQSDWLYEILEPTADEIVVTVPDKPRGSKSDAADAWARADELRRGAIVRAVYKKPPVASPACARRSVPIEWRKPTWCGPRTDGGPCSVRAGSR